MFDGIIEFLKDLWILIEVFVRVSQAIAKIFGWIFQAIGNVFVWVFQAIAKVFPVLIILALTVVVSKARRHFFEYLEEKSQRKESLWKAALVTALQKPAGLIIWIVGISFVLQFIHFKTNEEISAAVLIIEVIAIIAALVWFFIQFSKNLDKDAILMAISSKFKKKDKDDE